jgi:hypothetical protein
LLSKILKEFGGYRTKVGNMARKIDQLEYAKDLLGQALGAALTAMPNNRSVLEAKGHIKQAINKLDKVAKTKMKKKKSMTQTQHDLWWGEIQAGTTNVAGMPTSAEAQQRSLDKLNVMIDDEQKKIDDLEKSSPPDELLQD